MAILCLCRRPVTIVSCLPSSQTQIGARYLKQYPRFLQSSRTHNKHPVPSCAFAFEYSTIQLHCVDIHDLHICSIDGVLLRSSKPLPRAHRALSYLQSHRIPFILLTNGGGKSEQERVQQLSQLLEVPLDISMFIQSHTPFADLADGHGEESLKDKCILVVGGEGDKCRRVAEG